MANVEHSALTGSNLHESKGVSTAAVSTVYVADGAGSGAWATLAKASLASTAKSFTDQLFHLRQTAASGTGGGTLSASTWTKRTITSVTNDISGASVAAGVITLPAGTYWIDATVQTYACHRTKSRLRNTTDGTTDLIGLSCADGDTGISSPGILRGRVIIAGTKNFEIQSWASNGEPTYGQGANVSSGDLEVYVDACIWKTA